LQIINVEIIVFVEEGTVYTFAIEVDDGADCARTLYIVGIIYIPTKKNG